MCVHMHIHKDRESLIPEKILARLRIVTEIQAEAMSTSTHLEVGLCMAD